MMEIPTGKWCGDCPLWREDDDGYQSWCTHPDFPKVLEEEMPSRGEFQHVRHPACCSAYPNGATVTITAKEKP